MFLKFLYFLWTGCSEIVGKFRYKLSNDEILGKYRVILEYSYPCTGHSEYESDDWNE